MKVALVGATGFVGTALVAEFQQRGHEITAIARTPKDTAGIHWIAADATNPEALAAALEGADVVVSAFNAGWTNPNLYDDFLSGSKAVQQAVKQAGVPRYIVIGGAGSLFVAPGVQAVDTPDFPKEYYAGASAARDYLTFLRDEKELDWVFFSPAFEMHPGIDTGRTGQYRTGLEEPVFDANNRSVLSVQDLAVVIADEVKKPQHHRQRFTAAY